VTNQRTTEAPPVDEMPAAEVVDEFSKSERTCLYVRKGRRIERSRFENRFRQRFLTTLLWWGAS
jgi:hypothetical protein